MKNGRETEREDDPLRVAARKIASAGLGTPAILFLEGVKPLGFVASQFLRFVEPLLSPFSRPGTIDAVASAVEERDGVERFVREIERFVSEDFVSEDFVSEESTSEGSDSEERGDEGSETGRKTPSGFRRRS